jgi:hypothetical protein
MEKTKNLSLPLLIYGQLNKDTTFNEALLRLDSILNSCLESLTPYSLPPSDLEEGKLILVDKNAKEVFEEFANHLAFYMNGWHFIKPKEGLILWVKDERKPFVFNGNHFVEMSGGTSSNVSNHSTQMLEEKIAKLEQDVLNLENLIKNPQKFGINATADENNKLAVRSSYSLFNAEISDVRIVLNKANTSSSASFIFQQNWSGIAEFGTINGNNFILKVASGGIWKEVFEIDSATGRLNFKQDVLKNGIKVI